MFHGLLSAYSLDVLDHICGINIVTPAQVCGTKNPNRVLGGAGPLCPGTSDVNFLGDLEGVVELYTDADSPCDGRSASLWFCA
jgi:hypothetical protein